MSSPMRDIPAHLLIPVDADGRGPTDEAEADHWACWCGNDECAEATKEKVND